MQFIDASDTIYNDMKAIQFAIILGFWFAFQIVLTLVHYIQYYQQAGSMHSQQNVFSTTFFLSNTNKGFSLHKIKKNSISSNYKFKSKINALSNKCAHQTTLPYFKQDSISDHLLRDAKTKLNEKRKCKNQQLHKIEEKNQQDIVEQIDNFAAQFDKSQRSKVNSITFEPTFPGIDKKKQRINSKSFRSIENQPQQMQQHVPKRYRQPSQKQNSRTIELHKQAISAELDCLITKQILKTENQCILRQGLLKFDETKLKSSPESKKHHRSTNMARKKRKRNEQVISIERLSKQQNPNKNPITFEGPSIQKFSPIKFTCSNNMYHKQLRPFVRFNSTSMKLKYNTKRLPQENAVEGWDNQNLSQPSEVLISDQEHKEQHAKIYFANSERLNS